MAAIQVGVHSEPTFALDDTRDFVLDLLHNNKFFDETEDAPATPEPASLATLAKNSGLCDTTVAAADLRPISFSLEEDGSVFAEVNINGRPGAPPTVCVDRDVVNALWFVPGTSTPTELLGRGPEGYSKIARILRQPMAVTSLVVNQDGRVTAADKA